MHLGPVSTRKVALLVALFVALAAGLAAWAGTTWGGTAPWWPALLAAVVFAVAYAAVLLGIERFVHQRIQALYRTVHDLRRGGPKDERPVPKGDVLDQVHMEVRAWANERRTEIAGLQEREKFRREFIGNLSHELKTPIFNIQGYILTLLEGGLEDERVNRDFLDRASNGVDRLMQLVEDLDMITKLESGVMELREADFDLHELVAEAMAGMELKATGRGITLVNEVAPGTRVQGDRARLAQVLTNLLGNAIVYGRAGGSCTVRTYPLGEQLVVDVADDGVGIAKEHLPRLFERFYRVGKSRARHEGGSGLGLAIVKHIIDAHRQTITVKSTEGVGSTFSFTLRRGE
ncbi:MAG: ATP-binding protein [Flavobacteriales bacterium]|jgi:two-component system phosphate regulon sensor histidine kinase PhoR|nr:ATP-binding protein [Flavobacteriales bacterium]